MISDEFIWRTLITSFYPSSASAQGPAPARGRLRSCTFVQSHWALGRRLSLINCAQPLKSGSPTRCLRPSAFTPSAPARCLLSGEGSLVAGRYYGLWAFMGHGLHAPSMCRLPLSQFTGNLMLGDKRLGGQSCSRARPYNPLARLRTCTFAIARTGTWRPQAQSSDCRPPRAQERDSRRTDWHPERPPCLPFCVAL